MATPPEKLAESLDVLRKFQNSDGTAIIQARDISRIHRERLLTNGFIHKVIKGWYISTSPGEVSGDSTAWYKSFWSFCSVYLVERFGKDWCLSPEQSLSLHGENLSVPNQLLVRSPKARNKITKFPHNTSLLEVRALLPKKSEIEEKDGLQLFSLTSALIACSSRFYTQHPIDVRAALVMIRDSSDILTQLLDGGHSVIAGRIAGAFRNVGCENIADEIVETMQAAGYKVRENNPFIIKQQFILSSRKTSPYINRIKLMWQQMREPILKYFPNAPGLPKKIDDYILLVDNIYKTDAYNSLSIEGYRVSFELIERVRSGKWNPDNNEKDKEHINALAARGYYQAFQTVKNSIKKVLNKNNPGIVVKQDHGVWYRELFSPSVTAGLLKASDLAGYRNGQVYIRQSKHVPQNRDAVREAMPVLFELLKNETEPAVRAVLGHFIFVYIHPYMDGNGRLGRFLMNTMLASGGYPWTVIPLEERNKYMSALEVASVEQNIKVFTKFIARLVNKGIKGKPLAKI